MYPIDLLLYACLIIIHAIALVVDIAVLPIYFILQRPWSVLKASRKQKAKKIINADGTITWRTLEKPKALHLEMERENLQTMADVMEYFSKKYENNHLLGIRQINNQEIEVQERKSFVKFTMGIYFWQSYDECNRMAESFGKGVSQLDSKKKKKIAIFAETRAELMLAIQGLFKQNIQAIILSASLNLVGIVHALNETDSEILITSNKLLFKIKKVIPKLRSIKYIIYMEDPWKHINVNDYNSKTLTVHTFDRVILMGSTSEYKIKDSEGALIENTFPKASDVAIIMYTSGSTDLPKGVQITHSNLIATLKAFADATEDFRFRQKERILGVLPLGHPFELLVESLAICRGLSIGYSNPLTLLDSSPKIKANCKGDISALRPQCMALVPHLLNKIVKTTEDSVKRYWLPKRILFYFGLRYKQFWQSLGFSTPLIDLFIFRHSASVLGGNLRVILSGGAKLTRKTHSFIETVFNIKIIQGYGLTESTACGTVMNGSDRSYGRVGGPTTGSEITLKNWVEGKYEVTDKPYPRGQIIVQGPTVCKGYLKHSDKDFYESNGQRCFKTGDIGEVQEDGCVRIIGRMNEFIKLENGSVINPGKIEPILKTCSIVDNICVHAVSNHPYCIALITPNEKKVFALSKKFNIPPGSFYHLCKSEVMNDYVMNELIKTGVEGNLEPFEIPKGIILISYSWTPDTGLVTDTMKLRRREILTRFSHRINKLFDDVHSASKSK